MRRIITTLAVLAGIGMLAAPASAQTTPPTTPAPTTTVVTASTIPGGMPVDGKLTITPATAQVVAGSKVSVTGSGVTVGTATLHLLSAANTSGIALGTATVSAAGVLSAEITIPAEVTAGTWFVRAIDGSAKVFAGELTIGSATTGTTVAPAPEALPNNGPLATLPVIIGAVVCGFAAMVFAPRKNKA